MSVTFMLARAHHTPFQASFITSFFGGSINLSMLWNLEGNFFIRLTKCTTVRYKLVAAVKSSMRLLMHPQNSVPAEGPAYVGPQVDSGGTRQEHAASVSA